MSYTPVSKQQALKLLRSSRGYINYYGGPSIREVESSIRIYMNDLYLPSNEAIKQSVTNSLTKFVERFFYEAYKASIGGSKTIQSFSDMCKDANKSLKEICDCISSQIPEDLLFGILYRDRDAINDQVHYLPKDYKIIIGINDEDNEDLIILYEKNIDKTMGWSSVRCCYNHLIMAILKVFINPDIEFDMSYKKLLASIILSCGDLCNQLNPNEELSDEYLDSMVAELQDSNNTAGIYHDDYFNQQFEILVQNIREGKLPYSKEMHDALEKSASFTNSPFSNDDYYLSSRGSSYTIRTRPWRATFSPKVKKVKHVKSKSNGFIRRPFSPSYESSKGQQKTKIPSYFMSCIERDPLKDLPSVVAFDNYIGYHSEYNTQLNADCNPVESLARIIAIDNPSKYKNRIIHVLCNALQDRCNWIHRRVANINNKLICDCYKQQDRIIPFCEKFTNDTLIDENHHGFYCWDFESATDYADQDFTRKCLDIIWPDHPEVGEFWTQMCRLTQIVRHKNKMLDNEIVQRIGQLQGALGSFVIFSFTHHIVNMLTMQLTNRQSYWANQFYRIVGDDNVMCTITEDSIINWNAEPGFRTEVELAHRKVCSWANLKINTSKSVFNEYDSNNDGNHHYVAEAIHLRMVGGQLMSPVPPKLILKYNDPKFALGSLVWASNHGYKAESLLPLLEQVVMRSWSDVKIRNTMEVKEEDIPLAQALSCLFFRSGISSDYIHFKSDILWNTMSDKLKACMIFGYWINKIRSSFLNSYLIDKIDAEAVDLSFLTISENGISCNKDLFAELFDVEGAEYLFDQIESKNHKITVIMDQMLVYEDILEKFAETCGLHNKWKVLAPYLANTKLLMAVRSTMDLMSTIEVLSNNTWLIDDTYANYVLTFDTSSIKEACELFRGHSSRRSMSRESMIGYSVVKYLIYCCHIDSNLRDEIVSYIDTNESFLFDEYRISERFPQMEEI